LDGEIQGQVEESASFKLLNNCYTCMVPRKIFDITRAPIHDFLLGGGAPSKILGGGG
jgi:hypothetical protein